jgi:hypothetical protein
VHALRNIHRMLVSGAVLVDLQPIPPSPSLHAGGELLGRLDQRLVWERFGKTEAGVDAAVGEGLYALESELEFDVIERFDSKASLIATISAAWPPVIHFGKHVCVCGNCRQFILDERKLAS